MYSVVIPVYNSVDTLNQLAERISSVFLNEVKSSFEILFVDDGSSNPETHDTLIRLSKSYQNVKSIFLMKNFGQIAALICGICHVRGQYIITMDDDLQHLPEDIPKLIVLQDHDIVAATFDRLRHGFFRRFTHGVKGWLDQILLGKPKGIEMSSFILIKRDIAEGIRLMVNPYPLLTFLLFSQTQDVVNVTATHQPRIQGKSGYSHFKRFHLFTNLIINHSPILLSSIGLLGLCLFIGSFAWLVFVLLRSGIRSGPVSEMTIILSVFLSVSGFLLFSLGIIGKYLFRILQTVINRPPYRIRKVVGQSNENESEF